VIAISKNNLLFSWDAREPFSSLKPAEPRPLGASLGLTPRRFRAHGATPARRLPCPTFPRTRSPLESHRQPRAPPANSSSGCCSTVCHQVPHHDPRSSCFLSGPLEGPSFSASCWPPTRGQKGPHTAEISCSPPTIILTGEASSPEGETDKNLVNRAHSPHRRLSHRNLKVSTVSLTSVDPAGHIIDLVHDQLPDISISEEDKKKNLALLEEAKLVSERFLTRRGRKSKSCPGDSQSAVALNLSPGASPASSQSNSLTVPTPPGLDACSGPESSLLGAPPQQKGDEAEVSSPHLGEPEHILMRNQNLVGLKLPDLSEAAEQEKGLPSEHSSGIEEDESKSGLDVMPNISDMLLRKLRVHRSLPGSAPPLTEKEVENVFVQLSLAFRNDSYTLESRINQAERERNLTEENTEKELENFKASITSSASLWHHCEHRETYQKLLEDIAVLHRLAARLSSRAEMVGAVRQEKRMSKATEVMMQYVENLKRTYEKDHAELMEFKKLANQNSSRSCGPSEDGVPRTARSMSLTLGKVCMFKEYQGSQGDYKRRCHSHPESHSCLDLQVPENLWTGSLIQLTTLASSSFNFSCSWFL
uniref:Inositol 1,4,5-triphosphate receptor associated 1 n=1 Tax=Panthera leo TaxID=9689 RepID=A0A8C8X780_PANLE